MYKTKCIPGICFVGIEGGEMRILVTGANGYLGQGIVKRLLDRGQQVVATDFVTNHVDDRARKINCDLFNVDNPYEEFDRPDVLLHLAWRDGFVHDSDAHIDDLPRHYRFIKSMIEKGIPQIAVMGTMHEVGFHEGSINEHTSCHPMNLYGISKNTLREATELLCRQHNVVFQWLRGYYIVGNSECGKSIFSKITAAAHAGKKTFPFTTGQNQYDFVDYPAFCNQVSAVVCQSKIDGVINICSGRPEKLADRVERFISDNGYELTLDYGAFPDRLYDSKAVWGDDTKIRKILQEEIS